MVCFNIKTENIGHSIFLMKYFFSKFACVISLLREFSIGCIPIRAVKFCEL